MQIELINIAKKFNNLSNNISIKNITKGSIIFIIILVTYFNGIVGLVTLFFSTSLGLFVLSNKLKHFQRKNLKRA
jgi:hypothetical protein